MMFFIQICNHNYLLADASHRRKEYRPLLAEYRALIVDEAHKLPEAARQMYGKSLCYDDIREIAYYLEREHQNIEARTLKGVLRNTLGIIAENHMSKSRLRPQFQLTEECALYLFEGIQTINKLLEKLKRAIPKWVLNRLEEAKGVLECFFRQDRKYVLHLKMDQEHLPVLCAASREIPKLLQDMLWKQELSAILTSGTLKAGKGFERTRQVTGLEELEKVQEYVAESPFSYEKNCLLYLPKTLKQCKRGSREEAKMVASHIHSLICSTYGHTLVLFTSYTLMGSVYQILRDRLPFPMVEVWRHSQEEIVRFKTMENAVLFRSWLLLGRCRFSGRYGIFPDYRETSRLLCQIPSAKQKKRSMEHWKNIYRQSLFRICRRDYGKDLEGLSEQKWILAWCLFWITGR